MLVVDNASTDGTADYLKTLDMPGLVCRNPGKISAVRAALPTASGRLRPSAARQSGSWTTIHSDAHGAGNPAGGRRCHGGDYGWLSGRALAPDGPTSMNLQRKTMYRDIDGFGDGKGEIPAVMASFVSLFLRIETVRQFGLPIAEFFIWSDDWDTPAAFPRKALLCRAIQSGRARHAEPRRGEYREGRTRPLGQIPLLLPQ